MPDTTARASRRFRTSVRTEPAGFAVRGRAVDVVTLASRGGVRMRVTTLGGIVLALEAPDAAGRLADVVLGYDGPSDYAGDASAFGALVGRYANRIRDGRFVLDGQTVQIDQNEGAHHLHGGHVGFGQVVWDAEPFEGAGARGVALRYTSPDGEGGYPGTLRVRVVYTLTDRNEWRVESAATTDRPTIVNLTQHPYFNLAGHGDVRAHRLSIAAGHVLRLNSEALPTGDVDPVDGSPFDFRVPRRVGARLDAVAPGYNHSLVLDAPRLARAAAVLADPTSGRSLTVRTTEPSVQLYTANHFDGLAGKRGARYHAHAAVCLEPQHFPDSPNHATFPSTVLRPGETFRSATVYAFGAGAPG